MHESRHILEIKKNQVEANLGTLFQLVENAIVKAMNCLSDHDQQASRRLMAEDIKLNELRRVVEQDCLVAIASQQPVANDLRDLVASMRMAAELERMGDYASDIAASILELDGASLDPVGLRLILDMSLLCREMLTGVMRAHQEGDVALARQVGAMDDQLDARMREMVDVAMRAMRADPALVNNGSRLLWIAHNLERCGDRATNIAEQILFRVEGIVEELD
mgnify:CR=1 FL=1